MTVMPRGMESSRQISKCSRVLRLNGFVGGDNHQHQIDSAHAGQHIANKTLVAGNVDEAEADFLAAGSREFQMREAEIDGNTASLLFFQTICINAGEGFDQRGLCRDRCVRRCR